MEVASPTQTSSGPDEEAKGGHSTGGGGFKIALIKAPIIRPKVQKYESLLNYIDNTHTDEALSEKEKNI